MTFLQDMGGCMLPPIPGGAVDRHFRSWRDASSEVLAGTLPIPDLDEGLTPCEYEGPTRCEQGNTRVFQSIADRKRYDELLYKLRLEDQTAFLVQLTMFTVNCATWGLNYFLVQLTTPINCKKGVKKDTKCPNCFKTVINPVKVPRCEIIIKKSNDTFEDVILLKEQMRWFSPTSLTLMMSRFMQWCTHFQKSSNIQNHHNFKICAPRYTHATQKHMPRFSKSKGVYLRGLRAAIQAARYKETPLWDGARVVKTWVFRLLLKVVRELDSLMDGGRLFRCLGQSG